MDDHDGVIKWNIFRVTDHLFGESIATEQTVTWDAIALIMTLV